MQSAEIYEAKYNKLKERCHYIEVDLISTDLLELSENNTRITYELNNDSYKKINNLSLKDKDDCTLFIQKIIANKRGVVVEKFDELNIKEKTFMEDVLMAMVRLNE